MLTTSTARQSTTTFDNKAEFKMNIKAARDEEAKQRAEFMKNNPVLFQVHQAGRSVKGQGQKDCYCPCEMMGWQPTLSPMEEAMKEEGISN